MLIIAGATSFTSPPSIKGIQEAKDNYGKGQLSRTTSASSTFMQTSLMLLTQWHPISLYVRTLQDFTSSTDSVSYAHPNLFSPDRWPPAGIELSFSLRLPDLNERIIQIAS
eukprot:g44270.t1